MEALAETIFLSLSRKSDDHGNGKKSMLLESENTFMAEVQAR